MFVGASFTHSKTHLCITRWWPRAQAMWSAGIPCHHHVPASLAFRSWSPRLKHCRTGWRWRTHDTRRALTHMSASPRKDRR
jgi:hypothetical protein